MHQLARRIFLEGFSMPAPVHFYDLGFLLLQLALVYEMASIGLHLCFKRALAEFWKPDENYGASRVLLRHR